MNLTETFNTSEEAFFQIYFVSEDKPQEKMIDAFEISKEYLGTDKTLTHLTEEECKNIAKKELTTTSIFVFDQYAWKFVDPASTKSVSEAFNYIHNSKCMILGPYSIISCFLENITIPSGLNCIYSFAMRHLIVCASGLTVAEKKLSKSLITKMGGYYMESLKETCTHLITVSTKTTKYEEAAKRGMIIMHPDWVKDVWKKCLEGKTVVGSDKQFEKYKLPIFYGLCITTTGLSTSERNQIKTLVEENGGKYCGPFKSEDVDILIVPQGKTDSEKFRAAKKYKKECLTPEWIFDSVKSDSALPIKEYKVEGLKASTPTKTLPPMFNPDNTQLSMISVASCSRNVFLDETQSSARGDITQKQSPLLPVAKYKETLGRMSLQMAKKAGLFLDGCNVYLSGFTNEEKDFLNKILNVGGATRFDELNERVTHVLIGELDSTEMDVIKNNNLMPTLLSVDWLLASLQSKHAANEADFVYSSKVNTPIEPPSPASKKSIKSMNNTFKKPEIPKFNLESQKQRKTQEEDENRLLQQYLNVPQAQSTPLEQKPEESIQGSEMCTEEFDFFEGKVVFIYGFTSEEDRDTLIKDCMEFGANLVDENYDKLVDYVICPAEGLEDDNIPVRFKHMVVDTWLEDSLKQNQAAEVKYYHKPFLLFKEKDQVLKGENFVVSNYVGSERNYLRCLITNLGADFYDHFKKNYNPILISPSAVGAKYQGAINWNRPVLKAEWLLECYKMKKRVPENDYLVGDSKPSEKNVIISSTRHSMMSPTNAGEISLSDDDSVNGLFKRPSISNVAASKRASTSDSESTLVDVRKSKTPAKLSLESDDSEFDRNDEVEEEEPIAGVSTRESPPVRRSPRNKTVQIIADEEKVETFNSPLRHKRINELTNRKSFSPAGSPSGSPSTPKSSEGGEDQGNISALVADMPTPQRQITYAALKEMQNKESPRSKRLRKLLETPVSSQALLNAPESPMPELPECMRTPKEEDKLGLRADASPDNHFWWKRKLGTLDPYYCPPHPESKKMKYVPTPPFAVRRYEVMKALLGDKYDSPEGDLYFTQQLVEQQDEMPRKPTAATVSKSTAATVQKSLSFDDDKEPSDVFDGGEPNPSAQPDTQNLLTEFIKKKQEVRTSFVEDFQNKSDEAVAVVDVNPLKFQSEMMQVEHIGVDWQDPSEVQVTKPNKMRFQGTPTFFMTQVADEKRKRLLQEQIEQLGGLYYNQGEFLNKTVTHLICDVPSRGHKYLSALAAGRYILHSKYVEDSLKYGFFLEEDRYEFGNPKFSVTMQVSEKDQELVNSAYRWRMKVQNDKKYKDGAFSGFKVLLISHKDRIPQFAAVIRAGGGEHVNLVPPFNRRTLAGREVTHCFTEAKMKLSEADADVLRRLKIPIILIMYLNAFLLSDQEPSVSKFLIGS